MKVRWKRPIEDRFWEKVIGPPDPNVCWIWVGCIRKGGYGRFRLTHTIETRAHQFAYELMEGLILEGFEPDHLCRNPRCVNPAHIEIVTHRVNMLRTRKTYCVHGHFLNEMNVYVSPSGGRKCKICTKERIRIRRRHGKV